MTKHLSLMSRSCAANGRTYQEALQNVEVVMEGRLGVFVGLFPCPCLETFNVCVRLPVISGF